MILFLAILCGISVANLYYIQPLEVQVALTFGVSQQAAGMTAMATQLGYAVGLFCITPLGDRWERRQLIFIMLVISALTLLLTAAAPIYEIVLPALFLVGVTSIMSQLIIPYAAHLTAPEKESQVIGLLLGGLLTGILVSRTVSGFIGAYLGWRWVYVFAAIIVGTMAAIVYYRLPKSAVSSTLSLRQLFGSFPSLIASQPILREASFNGFCMFASFSALWTSLIFLLESPYFQLGPKEAGLFGLLGIGGIIAAPYIGKVAHDKSPRLPISIGILSIVLAYIVFLMGSHSLIAIGIGVILLDLGNQCGQVSNMARVQALSDAMRSRNNTVFMVSYFLGGAAGSYLGTGAFESLGWGGVCFVGFCFQVLAALGHCLLFAPKDTMKA